MKLPHWSTLLRERDGSFSSTRAVMLCSGLVIVGTWSGVCIAHHAQIAAAGRMIDVPWGVVTVFAICCGLKYGQKFIEPPGPPPPPKSSS